MIISQLRFKGKNDWFWNYFYEKFIAFNKQINIYLNHFPNSEKYALSQSIRVDVYRVFDLIVGDKNDTIKKQL